MNTSLNMIQLFNYNIFKFYNVIIKNKYTRLMSKIKINNIKNGANNNTKYIASRKGSPEYANPFKDIITAIILGMPRAVLNFRHTTKWYHLYNMED